MSETVSLRGKRPRVIIIGLASCFGCQLQITNMEPHLLELLDQIDLVHWQLASSDPLPEAFDIAVVEGAVTTKEALETLRKVRRRASAVITIGACAATAGIPGMASRDFDDQVESVYGAEVPVAAGSLVRPMAVSAVIPVDWEVRCCPIDPADFMMALQRFLTGSNRLAPTATLCGECKRNERGCFYGRGQLCLGLVTRSGCGARCPNLGRPCNGCAGVSPDANVAAARVLAEEAGVPAQRFDVALQLFNATNEDVCPSGAR